MFEITRNCIATVVSIGSTGAHGKPFWKQAQPTTQ